MVAETQEPMVWTMTTDELARELERYIEVNAEAQRHIQQLENTLGIQAALLCGFAAILGPNSIAVSTDLFEAVSGQQVIVQPDLENHQLVFYAIAPTEAADVD